MSRLHRHYRGQYFKDFSNLLKTAIKYSSIMNNDEDVSDLKTILSTYDSKLIGERENKVVSDSGLDWDAESDPSVEIGTMWIKKDISSDIGSQVPIYIYIYTGQKSDLVTIQNDEQRIIQSIKDKTYNCDTDGRKWLERVAYLNNLHKLIDKNKLYSDDIRRDYNSVTGAKISDDLLRSMKQAINLCSQNYSNKIYGEVLKAFADYRVVVFGAKDAEEQDTKVLDKSQINSILNTK
jgi:hypothetical protein